MQKTEIQKEEQAGIKKIFTFQEVLNFKNAAQQWLTPPPPPQTQQQVPQYQKAYEDYMEKMKSLMHDSIMKMSKEVYEKTSPFDELNNKSGKEINELIVAIADGHIIEQEATQQGPHVVHKHIFNHRKKTWWRKEKDTYSEFTAAVEASGRKGDEERKKLLASKVEITCYYAEAKPPFRIFPDNPNFRNPFKGFVIETDEEITKTTLMKK